MALERHHAPAFSRVGPASPRAASGETRVEFAVARLSQDTLPWYVRRPAKTIDSAALYALLVRLLFARLRARVGLPPAAER